MACTTPTTRTYCWEGDRLLPVISFPSLDEVDDLLADKTGWLPLATVMEVIVYNLFKHAMLSSCFQMACLRPSRWI